LLVVPKPAEATRSSRRNRRGRGHDSTWGDVRVLWCMFTFLEGGSPHKHEDQVRLANGAAATVWSPQHASYAGCLHDEIHNFNRLRLDQPLGRGLEHLEQLITRIQNSSCNPGSYNVEALQSSAMEVKPERMSLPSVAGIIDPADHLKGEHRKQFLEMADKIPLHDSPEDPIKPCLKLPHGCMLITQIILHPNCSIRGSGDDLQNYFYLLRHQEAWLHRNCVGDPVSGAAFTEYAQIFQSTLVLFDPCLIRVFSFKK